MRAFLRSKIHLATVTEARLDYVGSITIDRDLMERAQLGEWEKVLITSVTTGARLETYVMAGPAGSGIVAMNGACAHLIGQGEKIIIMAFELAPAPPTLAPTIVVLGAGNRVAGQGPLCRPEGNPL